jgi:hypothetical protein
MLLQLEFASPCGETLTHRATRQPYLLCMEAFAPGTPVFCIEGRKVGTLEASRECCMLVLTLESRLVAIAHSAVMSGDAAKVNLVCGRTGLLRYACQAHTNAVAPAAI